MGYETALSMYIVTTVSYPIQKKPCRNATHQQKLEGFQTFDLQKYDTP